VGLDFEGLLKNQPPQTPVALNEYELRKNATPASNTSTSYPADGTMSVTQVLDSYKSEIPNERGKLEGKVIKLKGTVETSGRSKQGDWILGFLRPGSTSPSAGMVVAGFDDSKEYTVALVKKGDEVKLKCTVSAKVASSVILENCSKL
jgi:hypothetical protein